MASAAKKKAAQKPVDVLKTLVREGRLDEDTAQFLKSLTEQSVIIRNAGRTILEAYRTILDAFANIRSHLNVVLNNVEDVENYNESESNDD